MRPPYWGLITSIKIIKKKIIKIYLTFLIGTLGGSLKKIAKKIIPKVETKECINQSFYRFDHGLQL